MKKQLALLIVFCIIALGATSFISYQTGKINSDETLYLCSATKRMTEEWQEIVIIKDDHVIYTGKPRNIPYSLRYNEIIEIANCDDDFAITIFVE